MNENRQLRELRSVSRMSYLAAFLTGGLTLATQLCCTRLAIQYFGSDSTTISAMIIAVLVGLAAGATCLGNLSDRRRNVSTMLSYMFVAAGLCVFTISFWGGPLATWISQRTLFGDNESKLALWGFALVTMLPLNFLLGGILPVLVNQQIRSRPATAPTSFGKVYAFETLGAAFGSIATAFFLIQTLGVFQLLVGCGLVSVLVGLSYSRAAIVDWNAVSEKSVTNQTLEWSDYFLLLAIAMASCSSLGMEVVWQRFFVVWFGSDTQSFAIVVAAILLGISLGAAISTKLISPNTNLKVLYGNILLLISIAIVLTTYVIVMGNNNSETWSWSYRWLTDYPVASRFVLAITILMVPTTLIGVGLPIAAQIWIRDPKKTGSQIGQVYATALLGNVIGVWLCGFVLVPSIGLRPTVVVLSGLCLVGGIGVNLLLNASHSRSEGRVWRRAIVLLVGIIAWSSSASALVNKHSELGLVVDREQWETVFYTENSRNTVAVIQSTTDPGKRKMLIDGVAIGESGGGVDSKQQLLAHLPFLVQPDTSAARVLTIGLGTGVLAGELLEIPAVADVVCVELSDAVTKAAGFFSDINGKIFEREDFRLVQGDGIRFLQQSSEPFDVIVSDAKSRPGHAGNVAFFSRDYYQICEQNLSEDGCFVQWISLKSSSSALKTILKSFSDTFRYGHIAIVAPDSVFAIGSKRKLSLEREFVDDYLRQSWALSLNQYEVNSFDDILSFYWLDQTAWGREIQAAPVNTFNRPVLESYALTSFKRSIDKSLIQLELIQGLLRTDMASDFKHSRFNDRSIENNDGVRLLNDLVAGRRACDEIVAANQVVLELENGWLDQAAKHYRRAMEMLPGMTRQRRLARIYRQLAEGAQREGKLNLEFSALMNIRELDSAKPVDEIRMAKILEEFGQREKALDHYYRALKMAPIETQYRSDFAYCLLQLGKDQQAASQFKRVLAKSPEMPDAQLGLGIAEIRMGMETSGIDKIEAAILEQSDLKSRLIEFEISLDSLSEDSR